MKTREDEFTRDDNIEDKTQSQELRESNDIHRDSIGGTRSLQTFPMMKPMDVICGPLGCPKGIPKDSPKVPPTILIDSSVEYVSSYNAMAVGCSMPYGSSPSKSLVNRVVQKGHLSILRHSSVTYVVHGVTKAAHAELTTSKHMAFTSRSLRYTPCMSYVIPLDLPKTVQDSLLRDTMNAHETYLEMISQGVPKEQARYALPQNTSVSFVMSGNLQAYWDLFRLRLAPGVLPELKRMVSKVALDMLHRFPEVFCEHPLVCRMIPNDELQSLRSNLDSPMKSYDSKGSLVEDPGGVV